MAFQLGTDLGESDEAPQQKDEKRPADQKDLRRKWFDPAS
jgi:hypothetical protein